MTSIPPHCILLPLNKGHYTILSFDDDDLTAHRWFAHVGQGGYVCAMRTRSVHGGSPYLHIMVMERVLGRPVHPGMCVDHINGDSLDNRRINLREITKSNNTLNRSKKRFGIAPYKGLKWMKDRSQWHVRISINGKTHHIGYYDDPVEAARMYDAAAKVHHGKYARLNFPD